MEGETMGEALVRLTRGPEPEAVAGLVSEETAEGMEDAINGRSRSKTTSRGRIVEQFEESDGS
jgi:hypothetical protein